MKYLNNQNGNALVLTVILLMVVTILGSAMLLSVTNEVRINRNIEDKMIATYLAQAGIDYGLYIIENASEDFEYPHEEEIILGNRSRMYEISITEDGSEISIKSTGKIEIDGDVKKQVTLTGTILEDGQVVVVEDK